MRKTIRIYANRCRFGSCFQWEHKIFIFVSFPHGCKVLIRKKERRYCRWRKNNGKDFNLCDVLWSYIWMQMLPDNNLFTVLSEIKTFKTSGLFLFKPSSAFTNSSHFLLIFVTKENNETMKQRRRQRINSRYHFCPRAI